MTLAEAVDWVEQELLPLEQPGSGEIKRRIEYENDRICRELRIPTQFIEDLDATMAFSLPVNARDGGLLKVYEQRTGAEVPWYSVAEVSAKYPRWAASTFQRKLVVYDPSNVSAPITPKGFTTGDQLRVLYVIKPAELNEDTDELLNAEFSEYHDVVTTKVAADVLVGRPEEHLFRRGRIMLSRYQELMKSLFAKGWYSGGMW